MSGSAGHLKNVWEVRELTFGDLKTIVKKSLSGKIKALEKLDGQNLMVSFKNGEIIGARNTSHLKNFGENALSIQSMEEYFESRPTIKNSFISAMISLKYGLQDLCNISFFKEGKIWLNLEMITKSLENVIPYNTEELRLHNFQEVNENGKIIRIFRNNSLENFSTKIYDFEIKSTNNIKIKPDVEKIRSLIYRLDYIKCAFHLYDKSTINDYIAECIAITFRNIVGITEENIKDFQDRWAYENKSMHINHLLKKVDNGYMKSYLRDVNKNIKKMIEEWISPIEAIFLNLGAIVLKNTSQILSKDSIQGVADIKNKLSEAKDALTEKKSYFYYDVWMKKQLHRLEECGGVDSIVPLEGIVFEYKNHLLKFTGPFAPVNQIIGKYKYK